MIQIGTKIYYCALTGNVLQIIGDMQGYVTETTFEQDIEIYSSLKDRDISTIGLLKFEFREYPKLSEGSTGVKVNVETKELIFSYETLPDIPQEPDRVDMLENKISILEEENIKLKSKIDLVNTTHSDLIFDIDFRVMDIEDTIGISPVGINLFNLKGEGNMNSTFVMLLDKIESGNYKTREEIEAMADRYLARNRISIDEYDILMKALDKKELEKNPAEL